MWWSHCFPWLSHLQANGLMSFAINIPAAPLASFFLLFSSPFFFCNIGRNQQKYLTKFFVLGLQKIPWVSRQISLSAFFVTQYLWNVVIKPRWSECSFLNNKTGEAMKGKFFFFFKKGGSRGLRVNLCNISIKNNVYSRQQFKACTVGLKYKSNKPLLWFLH